MSDLNLQTIFLKSKILFCFIFTSFAGFSGALITGDLLWQSKNCVEFSVTGAWIQILSLLPAGGQFTHARPPFPPPKEGNISFAELWGELVRSEAIWQRIWDKLLDNK